MDPPPPASSLATDARDQLPSRLPLAIALVAAGLSLLCLPGTQAPLEVDPLLGWAGLLRGLLRQSLGVALLLGLASIGALWAFTQRRRPGGLPRFALCFALTATPGVLLGVTSSLAISARGFRDPPPTQPLSDEEASAFGLALVASLQSDGVLIAERLHAGRLMSRALAGLDLSLLDYQASRRQAQAACPTIAAEQVFASRRPGVVLTLHGAKGSSEPVVTLHAASGGLEGRVVVRVVSPKEGA